MNDTHALQKEIAAARVIREQIQALAGDDTDLIRDTLEGETNLREILTSLIEADGEDEALIEGMSTYQKKIADRKAIIERRLEIRRALMASALDLSELQKLETTSGTISRKALPPKAIISDESQIPSEFFEPQPPKLDKKKLLAALKEGEAITGANLSNGGQTISIRR